MRKSWLWFLFIFITISACYKRPELDIVPAIGFKDFYFKAIKDISLDSLVLTINFEDGDGDLGLESNENDPPYQLYDVFVNHGDTLSLGDNDTLPAYNCIDYEIIKKEVIVNGVPQVVKADTIYVRRNLNHYNFYLYFLVKQDDGTYKAYDPAVERNCAPPYHGRFFLLNTQGDIRPLRGELQYRLVSGFRLLFRNDSIKIQVQIQDRALHKSNIITTDPFMINDIIRPAS